MPGETRQQIGSRTARGGFRNEYFVIDTFNDWENNQLAREWLEIMGYNLQEIVAVEAHKITGSFKTDVQVQIRIHLKTLQDVQNISVKLVSNEDGYNQIDKRWIRDYKALWDIPDNVENLLKYYSGENEPYIDNPRDSRRMFLDEFTEEEQETILNFIRDHKILIVTDILKGRGEYAAEWMLVILRINGELINWTLKPMDVAMNFFGNGEVEKSPRGSIKIGKITLQRKGGDGGADTAKKLQFKINPCEFFDN